MVYLDSHYDSHKFVEGKKYLQRNGYFVTPEQTKLRTKENSKDKKQIKLAYAWSNIPFISTTSVPLMMKPLLRLK